MFSEYIKTAKKNFLNFFPTPRFLAMPAFGLNISDHSVKVLELIPGPKMKLGKFGDEQIPDNVVKSGSINKKDILKEVLESIKKKYDLSLIRVSLPEEKAYVFKLKVPNTDDEKQIRSSIEFQLEENVPISVEEALFDYVLIPGSLTKNNMEIGVSVLPRKIIASYINLFNDVGMMPLSFEVEAESIARETFDQTSALSTLILRLEDK